MSYYLFNREEWMQKTKDRYHKGGGRERVAEYYEDNKEVLRKNAKNKYRSFSEEEKEAKRAYGRDSYKKRR